MRIEAAVSRDLRRTSCLQLKCNMNFLKAFGALKKVERVQLNENAFRCELPSGFRRWRRQPGTPNKGAAVTYARPVERRVPSPEEVFFEGKVYIKCNDQWRKK